MAGCEHPEPCGCEVALCCDTCPLSRCQFELPPQKRKRFMHQFRFGARNALIRAAAAAGAERTEIASAARMHVRSVYRLLQEAK